GLSAMKWPHRFVKIRATPGTTQCRRSSSAESAKTRGVPIRSVSSELPPFRLLSGNGCAEPLQRKPNACSQTELLRRRAMRIGIAPEPSPLSGTPHTCSAGRSSRSMTVLCGASAERPELLTLDHLSVAGRIENPQERTAEDGDRDRLETGSPRPQAGQRPDGGHHPTSDGGN